MAVTVIDYLKNSAERFPDKAAFVDERRSLTYSQMENEAHSIAWAIMQAGAFHKPVAVYLDKSVECIAAFMGAACSGNFYTPLDTKMPQQRIEKIMDTLSPAVIVTDEAHEQAAREFAAGAELVIYEQAVQNRADIAALSKRMDSVIDSDVLYVLFTSGSTGVPKGAIIPHRAVVDYTEWGSEFYGIDDSYIFGNQTQFYFSMSVFDIYQTLRNGATMHIIPRVAFSFPVLLMQYMYEHRINTIYWVPSALSIVSTLGALSELHLPELKNVIFAGEEMPVKQLNRWIAEYPDVRFANMYGPTEITDICTVYVLDRRFEDNDRLPIGHACKNMDVFLLDEQNKLVEDDSVGEVCVRGTVLAYGYYNAPEKTAAAFVQNPLNTAYQEMIYRTGDLAKRNERGELVYISRKDFQIKHMGHRIELGEIEAAANSMEDINAAACLYDSNKKQIVALYSGRPGEVDFIARLRKLLPEYMMPGRCVKLAALPLNQNGKIDRTGLKAKYLS